MKLKGRRKSKNVDDQRHPLGIKYINGMNRIEGDNIDKRNKEFRDAVKKIKKMKRKPLEKVKSKPHKKMDRLGKK